MAEKCLNFRSITCLIPNYRGLNPNFIRYYFGSDSSMSKFDRDVWEYANKYFDMANMPTDFYFATTDSNCPSGSH